jgi:hypothetical protein
MTNRQCARPDCEYYESHFIHGDAPRDVSRAKEAGLANHVFVASAASDESLRGLALAATPGPWRTVSNRPFGPWVDEDCKPLDSDSRSLFVRNWKEACQNAAFGSCVASRYSDTPSERQFIDLHALTRNAAVDFLRASDRDEAFSRDFDAQWVAEHGSPPFPSPEAKP